MAIIATGENQPDWMAEMIKRRKRTDSLPPISIPSRPQREPTQFEEQGPMRPGRAATLGNVAQDVVGAAENLQSHPESVLSDAQVRMKSYLPRGGYDINDPVPVDYPIRPASLDKEYRLREGLGGAVKRIQRSSPR